ncbi:MAG: alpha-amylase family glycosyl hydrolase [Alistipes sp.]|nr:alpha-amylase family glycosyl hydrolase [Alistipes senegalensis]MCM1250111.1 alpha-amylase family glycosyl hydrolase [Alistipes sp.]
MRFRTSLRYLSAAAFLLWAVACSSDKGGTPEPEPVPGQGDIVDRVSQYEARPFDGEKRADVFYEIFVRSFADSDGDGIGDLNGVTAKLDYLDDLGVAGIWLLPVYVSGSEHGYDVIDYKDVNPDYGTLADLENLIAEAHKRHIRVILDFVPNHTSHDCPWFTEACKSTDNPYRSFYHFSQTEAPGWCAVPSGTTDWFYQGVFDRSMPDLNYGPASSCETSGAFLALTDAAKFWVDKGVDGFRLDAVKHIYDSETSAENPTWLEKFYSDVNAYFQGKSALGFKDIYMVGECWMATAQMAPYYKGLPALFDFTAWQDRLLYAIKNSHVKWFPKDMIDERETFASVRPDFIQATKLSNHDENRARTAVEGSHALSLERCKIAAAVLLTSVGSPYVYYGEELGMFGDKADKGGDRNVREPMLWKPKAEDSERPTWISSTRNTDIGIGSVAKQADDVNSLYNVYRKFMRLRNTYPALASGEIELPEWFDDASADQKQVMAFIRSSESERLLVVHNVSDTQTTYTFSGSIDRPVADMNGVRISSQGDSHTLAMPPYSSIVIQL